MVASTSLGNELSKLFKVFDNPSKFYDEIMNASGKQVNDCMQHASNTLQYFYYYSNNYANHNRLHEYIAVKFLWFPFY